MQRPKDGVFARGKEQDDAGVETRGRNDGGGALARWNVTSQRQFICVMAPIISSYEAEVLGVRFDERGSPDARRVIVFVG